MSKTPRGVTLDQLSTFLLLLRQGLLRKPQKY